MKLLSRIALALLLVPVIAHAAEAGHVAAEGGTVERYASDGQRRGVGLHDPVNVGDVIVTGRDGWVVLSMSDAASLTLKANTRMRLGDYHDATDSAKPSIFIDLLTGSLRSITGLIGHHSPDAYRVKTPTATMGIRGTDHEVVVLDRDQSGTPAGTYDHVYDGRTVMRTKGGELELAAGETAAAPAANKPPGKLDKQPAIYDKLQQFSREHDIDKELDKLHGKSGKGYTLPGEKTTAGTTGKAEADSSADKGRPDKDAAADKVGAGDKDRSVTGDKDAAADKKDASEKGGSEDKDAGKGRSEAGEKSKEPPHRTPVRRH